MANYNLSSFSFLWTETKQKKEPGQYTRRVSTVVSSRYLYEIPLASGCFPDEILKFPGGGNSKDTKSQAWSPSLFQAFSYSMQRRDSTQSTLLFECYYTLAAWRFKPFLSVGWRVHSYLSAVYSPENIGDSALRKKVKKRKRFAECATPCNKPSFSPR